MLRDGHAPRAGRCCRPPPRHPLQLPDAETRARLISVVRVPRASAVIHKNEILLDIVGAGSAAVLDGIDVDSRLVPARVRPLNGTSISLHYRPSVLLQSPAFYEAHQSDFLDEIDSPLGIAGDIASSPAPELVITYDGEDIDPVSHDRQFETVWRRDLGYTAGTAAYSEALRWVHRQVREFAVARCQQVHGCTPRYGSYGHATIVANAFVNPQFYDPPLTDVHKQLYRPGGPYAWSFEEMDAITCSMYAPNAFLTPANYKVWIHGTLDVNSELCRQNAGPLVTFRRGVRPPPMPPKVHLYPYLSLEYNNSDHVKVSQELLSAALEALAESPHTVRPVFWASVVNDGTAISNLITQINDRLLTALDAAGVPEQM